MNRYRTRIEKLEREATGPQVRHRRGLWDRIRKARVRCGLLDTSPTAEDLEATRRMGLAGRLHYYRMKHLGEAASDRK